MCLLELNCWMERTELGINWWMKYADKMSPWDIWNMTQKQIDYYDRKCW